MLKANLEKKVKRKDNIMARGEKIKPEIVEYVKCSIRKGMTYQAIKDSVLNLYGHRIGSASIADIKKAELNRPYLRMPKPKTQPKDNGECTSKGSLYIRPIFLSKRQYSNIGKGKLVIISRQKYKLQIALKGYYSKELKIETKIAKLQAELAALKGKK